MAEQAPDRLRLYVWPEYCPNYADGIAVAIATSEEAAKAAVIADEEGVDYKEWGPCEVREIEAGVAYSVHGGA